MATMGEALVGTVAKTIADRGEHKVLVVGCRGDNFPPRYREHKQLEFWESTGSPSLADRIPADVRLVLTTRFIGHPLYEALSKTCAARNIVFGVKNFGTGEIKSILRPFMNGHDEKEEAVTETTMPTGTKPKVAKGALIAFVKKHYDPSAAATGSDEAKRLLPLAHAQGLMTTWESIAQSIYTVKSAAKQARKDRRDAKKAVPASTVRSTSLDDDDHTIIQMLDDMAAAVALVRQEVMKRSEKRHQLKELLKSL